MNNIDFEKILAAYEPACKDLAADLVAKIDFLRGRLAELEELPFIHIKPDEPTKQKPTPAAKKYKELSQQYNSYIQTLIKLTKKTDNKDVTSPLREYFKNKNKNVEQRIK